jgi:hypothetical protein
MIDVKKAAEIARAHLIDLLGKQEIDDEKAITLEEFELAENRKHWSITLGYPVRETRPKVPLNLPPLFQEPRRKFKTFRIDTKAGKVLGMKYAEQ